MTNRINIDTRGLPITAAVWQAPKIIGASVWAGLAGGVFLVLFVMGTAFLQRNSPLFNKNAQLSREHYERCILNFVNQGVRPDNTRAHMTCTVEADAYRARLESRGN